MNQNERGQTYLCLIIGNQSEIKKKSSEFFGNGAGVRGCIYIIF